MNGQKIAEKIQKIVADRGVKKAKIGEILGAPKTAATQWKYQKYAAFLEKIKKGIFDFPRLKKLAAFLNVDFSAFFPAKNDFRLAAPKSENPPENSIRAGLKKMGFSEKKIQKILLKIKNDEF